MSSISPAYSEYIQSYPAGSFAAASHLDNAFSNEYAENGIVQIMISITGFVKKNLHSIHNTVATNVQENEGRISVFNGCRIAIVEIGLLATALILAPIETVIRAVITVVVAPFSLIAAIITECSGCSRDITENLATPATISLLGLAHTAIHIPETMISAFYSHLANYDTPIDYLGHGNYHILCEAPQTIDKK